MVLLTRGVELTQSDFAYGSYVITSPGLYTFEEDIVFHPNGHLALNHSQPEDFLFPTLEQLGPLGAYSGAEYSLGFFAALVIASDNVVVDLKGHRLEQSPGHALMQRFYAHIEVANSPFPGGAGPASFATKESFVAVKNVTIKGGTLGLSAHHSIHGNGCELVTITDMTLTDFEVAGISLNSAKGVVVNNVDIKNSRRDVPISGRFSQAIFALRTATRLLDLDPALSATSSVQRAVQRLRSVVSPVIANVSEGHPVMYPLFASLTSGLPDGSLVAGLLFHPKVHVGDFLHPHQIDTYAQDISIDTVNIYNLSVAPIEIAALRKLPEEAEYAGGYEANQVHDNSGGVLDVDTIRDPETEKYVGTPLSELQLTLATYGIECQRKVSANSSVIPVCLQKEGSEALLKRNKITSEILKWAGRSITFSELLNTHRFELVPNFDYMFHFNKGVIGIKLDGVTTASMNNVDVSHLENHATQQERSILFQTAGGYRGFDSRAVAISSSAEVTGEVSIRNILQQTWSRCLRSRREKQFNQNCPGPRQCVATE